MGNRHVKTGIVYNKDKLLVNKAFRVDSGDLKDGCFLVFALTRSKAQSLVARAMYWEYTKLRTTRQPDFDKYIVGNEPIIIESNDELPKGVSFYYNGLSGYNDEVYFDYLL